MIEYYEGNEDHTGKRICYYYNGKTKSEEIFEEGQIVSPKVWNEDGDLVELQNR